MSPFFSVVIPTYNRSSTILPTLASVVSQSFDDFECIVVDDGSSDVVELEQVVRGLDDARFRVVSRSNGGGGAARNTGIDAASGRYIAFLDSDDLFLEHKLRDAQRAIQASQSPATTVFFSQIIVDRGVGKSWVKPSRAPAAGERIDEYLILRQGFMQTSTIVLDRHVAAGVRFDERLSFGQDTDFCVRLAAAGYAFHMLEEPTVIWKDDTVANRVSSNRRSDQILSWTDRNRSSLSARSYLVYRGWHGAKAAYASSRAQAAGLYTAALVRGAFPPMLAARVALQVFLPPARYRAMADAFVRLFGSAKSKS